MKADELPLKGRTMKKVMNCAVIVLGLLSLVLMTFEMAEARRIRELLVVVAICLPLLAFQIYSFDRKKPAKSARDLGDDDGGIDWREENGLDTDPQIQDGWAVLLDDVAVHEAKAVAETLENVHVRCRLEILQEDREFHRYGHFGMGTRMRVLVAPSDYDTAKRITAT